MVKHHLLQQPKKLECLAMDKLAAWIASQAKMLMPQISELHQEGDAARAEGAQAELSRQIKSIRNYLHRGKPKLFHDTLVSKTINDLYGLFIKTKRSLKRISDIEENVIGRMLETVFTENLTSLSLCFYQFTLFRASLRHKAHKLSGLIHLDLNFDASSESTKAVDSDIIDLLKNLHDLKYLTIKYVCTDNILRCIVENCRFIEELDVYSSIEINDKSVKILTQLHNLKSINMDKTSIGQKGIETLLLSCQNIEHIVVATACEDEDRMSYILEQLENSKRNLPKLFKIKTYINNSNNDSLEDLQLAFRMCPLIQNLTIEMSKSRGINIMAIVDLKHLRELTIIHYGFFTGQVKAALQIIGSNLLDLRLVQVTQLSLNALIFISKFCPNLQSLSLEQCTFTSLPVIAFAPRNVNIKKLKIPLFTNLKKLTLHMKDSFSHSIKWPSSWWHEPTFFLLSNCLNLEIIKCSIKFWLEEGDILEILDKNPLIHLKEFEIVQSYKAPQTMSSFVIDRIIENCINKPEVTLVLAP